jgi:phospholipid/cholesterol/gamma-HCH transport system substrate-binding protein
VDAGEVKRIRFIPPADGQKMKIQVSAWIRSNVKIPSDSTVWVNTLGLLGEKYIEIMPGVNFNNALKPNATLAGEDPMPMQEVTQLAKRIGMNLDEITGKVKSGQGTVGKFIMDDSVYNNLSAFTDDIKKNPWKLIWKSAEKK